MSEDQSNGQRRLTPEDPVSTEQINRLRLLQESRLDVAERFLTLEQEKVKLLAAARRIDEEVQRVFEGLLLERGLSPDATVEIDGVTGSLKVLNSKEPPPQVQAPLS